DAKQMHPFTRTVVDFSASPNSDFIPAMKFARREGVQVVLVTMGHMLVKRALKVHADELRQVIYP
ncbi:MAG TPA: hypothetical protein VJS17_06230, partial [Pyrinomonadaceae bacterium]|nr:hypothetical protein [Pyrinomonadaceae bacterium]